MCTKCGDIVSRDELRPGRLYCKRCYQDDINAYGRRHIAQLDEKFDAWLAKVHSVPKNYPTLTEAQWLAACSFFDGCARCHNDTIDCRGFFIGAKSGGRYCDWNVIPLCEKCAAAWNLNKSVFRYVEMRDHVARSKEYRSSLANIIEYLEPKLNAAAGIME